MDLLKGESVGDELRGLELSLANPCAEGFHGGPFPLARRPLMDVKIEVVGPIAFAKRKYGVGDDAVDADGATQFDERQTGVDYRLVTDRIDDGIERLAATLSESGQLGTAGR